MSESLDKVGSGVVGTADNNDLPVALRDAQGIVAEQLRRLTELANNERHNLEQHSGALRHAERQLDEISIQYRAARQRSMPTAGALKQRISALQAQAETLRQQVHESQHVLRQLDQLVRQIEMSSSVLTGHSGKDDPWALALRAQVIQGREEERSRLAREVHDGPAQVLANSLMLLESGYALAEQTSNEKLINILDRLRGSSREGLQEVRRFIADLRPGLVRERGLIVALDAFVHEYNNAYHAQVSLEVTAQPRLPEDVEIVLYRIVQEALQNAYKYARNMPVHVQLYQQGQEFVLTIRDEGPGFDPHEVVRRAGRSNWGLMSMRERAELVGAHFVVASRPGQGTEVTVKLPV